MKCNVCGTEQDAGRFCISCGSPMADDGDERTYLLDPGQNPLFSQKDIEEDDLDQKTRKLASPSGMASPSAGQNGSVCTVCGTKIQPGDRVCAICGSPVSGAAPVRRVQQPAGGSIVCTTCGSRLPAGTKVCQTCGMPLANGPVRNTPMNPRAGQRPAAAQSAGVRDFYADDEEKTQKMGGNPMLSRSASMFEAPPVPEQSAPLPQAPVEPQNAGFQQPYAGSYQQQPYAGGYQNNGYQQQPYAGSYSDNGYQQQSYAGGYQPAPFEAKQPEGYADPYGSGMYQNAAASDPVPMSKGRADISSALDAIYDLTGGIFMLIFSAIFSLNLAYSIVVNSGSAFGFAKNMILNVFQILFCVALWMIFVNGKKRGTSTGGFTIIGVIMKIYMIVGIIGYVILILLGIVGSALLKSLVESLTDSSVEGIGIVIVIYVAVIAVFMTLFILYWSKLGRMNKSIASHIRRGEGRVYGAIYPLVFMIIGVIGRIGTLITKLVYSGTITELVREVESLVLSEIGTEYEEMYEQFVAPTINSILHMSTKYIVADVFALISAILIIAAIIKVGPAKRESM